MIQFTFISNKIGIKALKLLSIIVVLIYVGSACQEESAEETNKNALSSNRREIKVKGRDQLDVLFVVELPTEKNKNYNFIVKTFQKGDSTSWADTIWKSNHLDSGLTNFLGYIHDLPFEPSRNANYVYKRNRFELEKEFYGDEIDTSLLRIRLKESIERRNNLIQLADGDVYIKPKYIESSEEILQAKKNLENCLKSNIEYRFEEKNYKLGRKVFGSWLSLDGDLKVKVDYYATQKFIQQIAGEIERPLSEVLEEMAKQDPADTTTEMTFPRVNVFEEVENLMKMIPEGKIKKREIVLVNRSIPQGVRQGYTDFVEVSISDQKLWLFRGGSLLLETDVVTGNEKLKRTTPKGIFKILHKQQNRTLKGPGYRTFVSYWMPFYQGYGLHDATWRRRFGASIYQNSGSHGCVNIPPKVTPVVYESVQIGMPVIIR